jgi:hypothetical protein
MISALLVGLLMQTGTYDDMVQLRGYLGMSYPAIVQSLNEKNQILLRNTEVLAPAQAADMRAHMKAPDTLPAANVFSAKIDNVGQGIVTFLFEDDFITEQVNFVFCPVQQDAPARVMAVQVLLDDRRAVRDAVNTLQLIYQLPPPLQPTPLNPYQLALMYPIRPDLPITIWNLGPAEAIFQAIPGQKLISGQLWITDKTIATDCMNVPNL